MESAPTVICVSGLLGSLVSFVGFQEVIQLGQEGLAVYTVDHTGFFHCLAPGRGTAQAVHADGKKQGSGLRRYVQNITDDGIFFDFNSHNNDLLLQFFAYYNPTAEKKQEAIHIKLRPWKIFAFF